MDLSVLFTTISLLPAALHASVNSGHEFACACTRYKVVGCEICTQTAIFTKVSPSCFPLCTVVCCSCPASLHVG